MPKPKPLTGRIALITGSAGGIGKAIARKFASEGACVIISDNDSDRLANASKEFDNQYGKDLVASELLDVTNSSTVKKCFDKATLSFGGVDIIVNCAGLSISKPLE